MFRFASGVVMALVASATQALTPDEEYEDFSDLMWEWGYDWEAHKITTDDGFVLTTFHITGKTDQSVLPREESYMPIVFMNGSSCDATSWTGSDDGEILPLPLAFFEDGFDVWLAANRGTKYCQEHLHYDISQPEYWAWSWAEFGIYDDVANIKYVKEQTGKPKVSYLGVSQGTVQMFYAIAKLEDEFFADNLFTFAALDPCTIDVSEGDAIYEDGLFHFQDYGINALGDNPYWERDLKTICDNFREDICQFAQDLDGSEPASVQDYTHWAQNTIQKRFQEYAPNYMEGEVETELIPLSSIKTVPITMWSGLLDQTCSNLQAHRTAKEIGERVTYLRTIPWATHGDWGQSKARPIYEELKAKMINPEPVSYNAAEFLM